MHTKTFDVKNSKNQNFKIKTSAIATDKDIQTEEISIDNSDRNNTTNNLERNRTNNTINSEPPVMHPTVKKLDEIRKKFTTKRLIADCGKGKIGERTEYEYFAYVRRQVTWLVKSWQHSLDTPFDGKNKERLEENEEIVEKIINEASSEKTELLIGKAFRNVKASFKEMFYTTAKLDKQQNQQNNQNGMQNNRNGKWNGMQNNRNGEWSGMQNNRSGEWNGMQNNRSGQNYRNYQNNRSGQNYQNYRNGEWNDMQNNRNENDMQNNENGMQNNQSGRWNGPRWNGQQWRQEQNGQWSHEKKRIGRRPVQSINEFYINAIHFLLNTAIKLTHREHIIGLSPQ